jgi:type IX secretion system PorP/SprF family membrane protein
LNTKLKYIVFAVLVIAPFCEIFSQDVEMSQYFSAPLHLNPAMAGVSYGPRATLNYRNQWSGLGDGFNGGYTTYMAGADMYIEKIRGGIGLLFVGDQVMNNLYGSYKISLMYAQQIKFNRKMGLRIGVQGTYIHARIKWNELLWTDMINPYTGFYNNISIRNPTNEPPPGATSTNTGEFGAGLLFFTEKLYVGFAANNMLMHKEAFAAGVDARVPMRFAFHLGANLPVKHRNQARYNIWVSPNVLFVNQGMAFQTQGSFLAGVSFMYFGLGYRNVIYNSDAVIGYLGFKKGKFRIGYSYDYTISKLMNKTGGTHELSFTFNWTGDDNSLNSKASKGYIPCPDILR